MTHVTIHFAQFGISRCTHVWSSTVHLFQLVNFIICSDEYLLSMNRQHLNHDYYTDIITFDLSESKENIEADIFISIDRVMDNAHNQKVPFVDEFDRVLLHGLLHLMNYDDKSSEDRIIMRSAEDKYLALRAK